MREGQSSSTAAWVAVWRGSGPWLGDAALCEGLDPGGRVLTIWEGVTMYLSEPAVEEAVACVRRYSAPGSRLVVNSGWAGSGGARPLRAAGLPHHSLHDPPAYLRVAAPNGSKVVAAR